MNLKDISKSDYESLAGSDWPSYDDFQNQKFSDNPAILEEIMLFVKQTQQDNSSRSEEHTSELQSH